MTLKDLVPNWYDGVREFEVLMSVEDESMEILQLNTDRVKANQWIQTADEQTIVYHEQLLNIVANPVTESLLFRKQRILNRLQSTPPFTKVYLTAHLNRIFGEGNYELTIDYNAYQMFLETAAENANWFYEAQALIHKIKPANIEYLQVPAITDRHQIKETATVQSVTFFRAGRSRAGDPVRDLSTESEVVLS